MYPTWPYRPSEICELEKELLQEVCNVIFHNVKGSFKLNQMGYAETESKQLASKIWSMVNEWVVLLIPQKVLNN